MPVLSKDCGLSSVELASFFFSTNIQWIMIPSTNLVFCDSSASHFLEGEEA